jgi:CRP/FNR family transcriptional regulator
LPTTVSLLEELCALYPTLRKLPADEVAADVGRSVAVASVGPAAPLFTAGSICDGFPLVLSGEVRVSRGSASGRTLELYRVGPGDACIVSTASLLGRALLVADGTASVATRLALLPTPVFDRWTQYLPFRRFVFGVFVERLVDLMAVVDAVAFQRLDSRLAGFLLAHGLVLRCTHQALADELGTVREIVTRLLNRFEAAGAVRLGRERIEIVDATALRDIARGTPAPSV